LHRNNRFFQLGLPKKNKIKNQNYPP